jgi:hypothetical protein
VPCMDVCALEKAFRFHLPEVTTSRRGRC